MTDSWGEWEGRTVDGKFVLGSYLGGSEGSAVFRTRVGSDDASTDAAIKLVGRSGTEAESQLRRWQAASELSHPNLIRIVKTGRCTVEGRELVYAVEELAEENLAQIVPERALTGDEARGMLSPVLAALEFVHGRGLVHGRIRPSNILAAGDQVKLSSDSLRPAGEIPPTVSAYGAPEVLGDGITPASDMWSLGITLVEVLTQRVPAWDPARMEVAAAGLDKNVPEPFRGIALRCLQPDPAKRAGVREIAGRLEGKAAPATAAAAPAPVDAISATARKRANGPYLLVLAAAIVVTIFLIVRPRPSRGPADVHTSPAPPQTSSPETAPPTTPPQTMEAPPVKPSPVQSPSTGVQAGEEAKTGASEEIVDRATPQVSPSARRTIHGKLKVRVRVEVDARGNVTTAKLRDAGPSQYFAKAALEAARRWKFAPAPDETRRDWTLLFAFSRARTEMSASRAR